MKMLGALSELVLLTVAAQAAETAAPSHNSSHLVDRWRSGYTFGGIQTFAHLPHVQCLVEQSEEYDIGIIGVPFDTSVGYRPGARFGPRAIRTSSQRQTAPRGFNPAQGINPYRNWATVLDCGDIPVTPFDNAIAFPQMTEAYRDLQRRPAKSQPPISPIKDVMRGKDGIYHPRLITLGGDHSVALPALRSIYELYGPVSLLHFDSHLDTYDPKTLTGSWSSEVADLNHGTMFFKAKEEGLLASEGNVHAGLRSRLAGTDYSDYEHDAHQSFLYIETEDIDYMGINGIADRIRKTIGDTLVYLSIDIDVLEPGLAPGTGCPEPGGWTTRELKGILRQLTSLNIVGADIVEVAPAYDDAAESTSWAAADLVYEILGLMVGSPPFLPMDGQIKRNVTKLPHHIDSVYSTRSAVSEGNKDEL
ncbi:Guanidinobutyrase [Exophiala dermatitidis]